MAERPKNLHASKSFTRLEAAQAKNPLARSRASTLQGPPVPDILDPLRERITPDADESREGGDIFAPQGEDGEDTHCERTAPDSFEELPIEIRSLTERYSIYHRMRT
jgi:hypothetical protein